MITNTEFIKRTITIINNIDSKLKNSLGLDLGGFKNEVLSEMKKNINDGNENEIPTYWKYHIKPFWNFIFFKNGKMFLKVIKLLIIFTKRHNQIIKNF